MAGLERRQPAQGVGQDAGLLLEAQHQVEQDQAHDDLDQGDGASHARSIRLNVGCGPLRLADEIGVDLHATGGCDVQANLLRLPFRDGCADQVRLDHVLEHLDQGLTIRALAEAWRVLRPGGRIIVGVPDFSAYAAAWLDGPGTLREKAALVRGIYGGQAHAGEYHRAAFDAAILADVLDAAGFDDVAVREDDGPWRTEGFCITATGVKA